MVYFQKNVCGRFVLHTFHLSYILMVYTQSLIIRNGTIRLGAEFWEKFKKLALGSSNLRNASKNLRNAQYTVWARANLNKSKKVLTNTTLASK